MAALYSHDPFISSAPVCHFYGGGADSCDVAWMTTTPPVSPLRVKMEPTSPPPSPATDDDLDLGLGDIFNGVDLPCLAGFQDDWLLDDIPSAPEAAAAVPADDLRHDCMWSGYCPAKDYRHDSVMLSSSPTDGILSTPPPLPTVTTGVRTRLDTFGRPETPLSLSDSEMDGQFTSQEESSSSSSNSADESDDSPQPPHVIHAVRRPAPVTLAVKADHSYSHSDHCYHTTQRRPAQDDFLGIQTPSDSG